MQEQKKVNELFDATASDLDIEKGEVLDGGVKLFYFDDVDTKIEAHSEVSRYVASDLPQGLLLHETTGALSGTVPLTVPGGWYQVPVEVVYGDGSKGSVVLRLNAIPKEDGSERRAGSVTEQPDLGELNEQPDRSGVRGNAVPASRADLGKIIGGVLGGLLGLGILGGIVAALMNFFK